MVTDNLKLLWLYPFAVTLLFYYSKDWKAMGLFGNLVVAFFCCMVPGMILVAEYPILEHLSRPLYGHLSGIDIIIYYILFSFFSTLYREIVKDMEDIEGDKKVAYATLPIKIGLDKTKTFAQFQGIILLILLVIWGFVSWTNISIYASIFLLFSCFTFTVYTLAVIPKANDKVAFHKINNQIKLIMLSGLVYLALI
jgi:4-hydroxybenzoate polyprenyltransferase